MLNTTANYSWFHWFETTRVWMSTVLTEVIPVVWFHIIIELSERCPVCTQRRCPSPLTVCCEFTKYFVISSSEPIAFTRFSRTFYQTFTSKRQTGWNGIELTDERDEAREREREKRDKRWKLRQKGVATEMIAEVKVERERESSDRYDQMSFYIEGRLTQTDVKRQKWND